MNRDARSMASRRQDEKNPRGPFPARLRGRLDYGEPNCIAFGGLRVDDVVEEAVLSVAQPAAARAAVAAVAAETQTHARHDQAREGSRAGQSRSCSLRRDTIQNLPSPTAHQRRRICSPLRWCTTKDKPVACRRASPTLGRFGGCLGGISGALREDRRGQRRTAAASTFSAGTPERRPATARAAPGLLAATGGAW